MNREIKFRIWDNHTKCYKACVYESHKDCYLFIGRSGYVTAFNCYGEEIDFKDDRFIIQQYTGLKDSKGVEIYEGDIISFGVIDEDDLFWVVWEDIESRFILESNGGLGCWLLDVSDREVIGNIMENPELLKA